jgi:hypothetical protein
MNWIRASILEVYRKVNPKAKHLNTQIYLNGEDNLYPNTLINVINESPTGKRCANLMHKFIIGDGVLNDVDITTTLTLNDLSSQIASSISKVYEAWVWVGYGFNANGKIVKKNYKVLNSTDCRKQINDDNGNAGKIIVKEWFKENKIFGKDKSKSEKWYYPFNDNEKVVRAQIEKDFGQPLTTENIADALLKYRGQVYHINLTPEYHYALPLWDSVYNDMNTEAEISRYFNSQTRNGFLGKTMCVTKGLDAETEKQLQDTLKTFLGSDSSDFSYFGFDAEGDIENLKFIQLKPQFDDKLFENTKTEVRKNITGAFNNIPEDLIYSTGGLFGNGSDKYNEMKKFYWEQNNTERTFIINRLWELGFENVEFKPLYNETITTNANM